MQTPSEQPEYEYGEREVSPMLKRRMSLTNGQLSGYISSFLGVFSFFAVLCLLNFNYFTNTPSSTLSKYKHRPIL